MCFGCARVGDGELFQAGGGVACIGCGAEQHQGRRIQIGSFHWVVSVTSGCIAIGLMWPTGGDGSSKRVSYITIRDIPALIRDIWKGRPHRADPAAFRECAGLRGAGDSCGDGAQLADAVEGDVRAAVRGIGAGIRAGRVAVRLWDGGG
jgi:hypothetical protein